MSVKLGRRVGLLGQAYEWARRTGATSPKNPRRTNGQLLLRPYKGREPLTESPYPPHKMPAWVPPCQDRLQRPLPGYVKTETQS